MSKNTSGIEQWVVDKAMAATNSQTAESWLLVAKTLNTPASRGIDILLNTYHIHLAKNNTNEAAKCLHEMYDKHSKDDRFWREASSIADSCTSQTDVVKKGVLSSLPPEAQIRILTACASRSHESAQKLKLLLWLLRKFAQKIELFGCDLLAAAQSLRNDKATANLATVYLGAEIGPAVIGCRVIQLSDAQTLGLYFDALHLVIDLTINRNNAMQEIATARNDTTLLETLKTIADNPWRFLLSTVVDSLCKRYRYASLKALSEFSIPSIRHLCASLASAEHIEISILSLACLVWLVVHYQLIYNKAAGSSAANSFVLVAFDGSTSTTDHPSSTTDHTVPMKKRKFDASGVERRACTLLPATSTSANAEFTDLLAAGAQLHLLLGQRSQQLFSDAFADAHLQLVRRYTVDSLFFEGNYSDVIERLESTLAEQRKSAQQIAVHLQLASCYFNSKRTDKACELAIQAVKIARDDPKRITLNNCEESIKRFEHSGAFYTLVDASDCLSYTVRLVAHCLQRRLARSQHDDIALGHLLVLAQLDKSMCAQVYSAIQANRSFAYPMFFSYVFDIDILEMVSYWTVQQDTAPIHLQLIDQEAIGSPIRRSRTMLKTNKDGLRAALQSQVINSTNQSLESIVCDFLIHQQSSISKYAAV